MTRPSRRRQLAGLRIDEQREHAHVVFVPSLRRRGRSEPGEVDEGLGPVMRVALRAMLVPRQTVTMPVDDFLVLGTSLVRHEGVMRGVQSKDARKKGDDPRRNKA